MRLKPSPSKEIKKAEIKQNYEDVQQQEEEVKELSSFERKAQQMMNNQPETDTGEVPVTTINVATEDASPDTKTKKLFEKEKQQVLNEYYASLAAQQNNKDPSQISALNNADTIIDMTNAINNQNFASQQQPQQEENLTPRLTNLSGVEGDTSNNNLLMMQKDFINNLPESQRTANANFQVSQRDLFMGGANNNLFTQPDQQLSVIEDISNINKSMQMDDAQQKQQINFVVQQYESILQQLNGEFHALLNRNRESEDASQKKDLIISQLDRQVKDKDEQLIQANQQIMHLHMQTNELRNQNDFSRDFNQRFGDNGDPDGFAAERENLINRMQGMQNSMRMQQESDYQMQMQFENLQNRLRDAEQALREKDEQIFQAQRNQQAHDRDLQNLSEMEGAMKSELRQLNDRRMQNEDHSQDLRQQLCHLQIQLRQREMQLESCTRENKSLQGTLEIVQQAQNDVISETNILREQITNLESKNLMMRSHLEKAERDTLSMRQQIQSLESQLEHQKERVESIKANQVQVQRSPKRQERRFYPEQEQQYNRNVNHLNYQDNEEEEQQEDNESYVEEQPDTNQGISWVSGGGNNQRPQLRDRDQNAAWQPKQTVTWPSRQAQQEPQEDQYQQRQRHQYPPSKRAQNDQQFFEESQDEEQQQRQNSLNHYIMFGGDSQVWGANSAVPAHKKEVQRDINPAAGKKSTQILAQELTRTVDGQKHISQMQSQLSNMQIKRERLENEYRRMSGSISKNKQQIQKKQELEQQLEQINKEVQNYKHQLREMNSL